MNPVDFPDAFETVTIAGVTWSGTTEITGLAYEMGWDVQQADGKNGATVTRKGRVLATPSIRFDIVRDPVLGIDQFSEWYDTWVPLLKSCFVGEEPVGLTVEHPDAQALECDSVLVSKIGQIVRDAEDYGHGYADVSLIQFAPAKSVSTKGASGSKGTSGGGGGGPDPNDPITKRTNELNELLNGP